MRIRYLSDLHLEFIKLNKLPDLIKKIQPNLNEICILAGDIGNPFSLIYHDFMHFINENFKKTFVIAGNHEYYQPYSSIENTNNFLVDLFKVKFKNISFLDNTFEHYENKCFIGTTLWSKITDPEYVINDIESIPDFNILKYNSLHTNCNVFLNDIVEKNDHCIIITHHVP
jgi:predicted phosphohydrolase